MRVFRRLVAMLLFGCTTLVSCTPPYPPLEPKDALPQGVLLFRERYNAQDFHGIYQAASRPYKRTTSLASHIASVQKLFDSCGRFVSTSPISHSEERDEDGFLVLGAYDSQYERCALIEYFGFRYYSATNKMQLMLHSVEPR